MDALRIRFAIAGTFAALLISCATSSATRQPAAQSSPSEPAPIATKPSGSPSGGEPSLSGPHGAPSGFPSSAAAKPNPSPALSQAPLIKKGDILVTKEEYRKTLGDVRRLIDRLNTIIAGRDYEAWLRYLTPAYMATYSDSRVLAEISAQPLLKRHGIHLSSLKDYFLYVVVPSRADAQVDDLDFVSKDHVRAITVIDEKRYILYDLRLQDGNWRIGVS